MPARSTALMCTKTSLPPSSGWIKLIERVLPYQFDAQTTFAMEADGVHCTISLPAFERKITDHPRSSQ
jgi:hypothetical protein